MELGDPMTYKLPALLAASVAIAIGSAQAQVSSITYNNNSVSGGSYYNGATVNTPAADNYFFRNRYTAANARSHAGYDPIELQAGAFLMNPSLAASLTTTDNLFLTDTDETSDTFASLTGQVSARSTLSRHMFGFDALATTESYFDTGSEDATQYGVRGFGQLDVSSNFSIAGSVAYQDLREGRANIGGNVAAAERVPFERTGAEVNGAYEQNRIRVRLRASTQTFDFDDVDLIDGSTLNQDFRDSDETRLAAAVEYAVARDWSILGEIERVDRDFDTVTGSGLDRDIEGNVYRVGTNFELQNNLRGVITAGYLSFEPADPLQPNQEGLALNASVEWFPTQLTTVTATAGRDVASAGGVDASSVLVSQVGVGIAHELRRNLLLTANASYEQREFDPIDREDDQTGFGAGATWKVNRNIHVLGGIGYSTRDSDFEPFDETRASITVVFYP